MPRERVVKPLIGTRDPRGRTGPGVSRAGLRTPGTLLGSASGSGSLLGLALSAPARPLRAAPGNPPPARRVPAFLHGLLRTARPRDPQQPIAAVRRTRPQGRQPRVRCPGTPRAARQHPEGASVRRAERFATARPHAGSAWRSVEEPCAGLRAARGGIPPVDAHPLGPPQRDAAHDARGRARRRPDDDPHQVRRRDHVSAAHAPAPCRTAQSPNTAHAGTSATSMPTTTGTTVRMRDRGNIARYAAIRPAAVPHTVQIRPPWCPATRGAVRAAAAQAATSAANRACPSRSSSVPPVSQSTRACAIQGSHHSRTAGHRHAAPIAATSVSVMAGAVRDGITSRTGIMRASI